MMEVYPLYILILSATRERAEEIPEELRIELEKTIKRGKGPGSGWLRPICG